MIDFPTNAEVHCSDGFAGFSTYVIGNPLNHQVTHLVVKRIRPPFHEVIVSMDEVQETSPHRIRLKCTRNELEKMEPFEYKEYLRVKYPIYVSSPYALPAKPFAEEKDSYVLVKHHRIPMGEIAVSHGAKVEAIDGYVGLVDELLIDSNNMQLAYLVLFEGTNFTQREIAIPVSQIDHVDADTVYLKLDRRSIDELPTAPFERWLLQD